MDDGAIVVVAFFVLLGFIVWCSSKNDSAPSPRTEVLKELINSLPKYRDPVPMWKTTTTKRTRKVRRTKRTEEKK